MNYIALIPAREGSKRIKNKNFKEFLGKPLIYWTIDFALRSKVFKNIFVTTDSKNYSEFIKRKYKKKINIIIRPKKISKDKSNSMGFILHFLKKKKNILNKEDFIVLLQPTTPFREKSTLIKLIKVIKKFSLNSLICIHKISDIKNKFKKTDKISFKKILNLKLFSNSKYKVSGNFYFNKVVSLKKFKKINNLDTFFYIYNKKHEIIDIDTHTQWKEALNILSKINNKYKN